MQVKNLGPIRPHRYKFFNGLVNKLAVPVASFATHSETTWKRVLRDRLDILKQVTGISITFDGACREGELAADFGKISIYRAEMSK